MNSRYPSVSMDFRHSSLHRESFREALPLERCLLPFARHHRRMMTRSYHRRRLLQSRQDHRRDHEDHHDGTRSQE